MESNSPVGWDTEHLTFLQLLCWTCFRLHESPSCYPPAPLGRVAFLTHRLQNTMMLMREGEGLLSSAVLCFHSPHMVLIIKPLKPVLCQLVFAARFSLPPSFVWWLGVEGLAYLPVCVRAEDPKITPHILLQTIRMDTKVPLLCIN